MLSCVVLTACGGTVAGSAESDGRWDPCSIPEEAIAAAGLDPSYKDEGWGRGISVPDWSRCVYRGGAIEPTYFFGVKSADQHTVDDARNDSGNEQGVDLEIGGRDVFRYKTFVSRSVIDCNLAVDVSPGVVVFTVASMGHVDIDADPCELVVKHTTDLEKHLPKSE